MIDVVFNPPSPGDTEEVFDAKSFDTLSKLTPWSAQANTLASEVNSNAAAAASSASTATTKASEASSSANTASTKASEAASSANAAASSAAAAAALGGVTTGHPAIRPSLLLDFANSKHVDPRITVTRASTATYFDAQGVLRTAASGVPRIDHDPTTGECNGLLIEEARTNLLTYSEQFDNAAWTKTGATVTANAATAPDGAVTMDKIVEDTSNGVHGCNQSVSVTNGTNYCIPIFAKAGERSLLRVGLSAELGTKVVYVDLSSGVITGESGTGTASIQACGMGVYRISLNVTATATVSAGIFTRIVQSGTTISYTGDGTSGLYLWGAQMEAGAFPTSYIPTTSSAATRAADVASMSGTNFSEWYRQNEGTFVVESATNSTNGATSSTFLSAFASSSNYQRIRHLAGLVDITAVSGGALVVDSGGVAVSVGTFCKTAMAYKSDDYVQYTNGVSGGTDTSAALPVGVAALNIGSTDGAGTFLNGHIKRIAYYPKRLTGAELQALTA